MAEALAKGMVSLGVVVTSAGSAAVAGGRFLTKSSLSCSDIVHKNAKSTCRCCRFASWSSNTTDGHVSLSANQSRLATAVRKWYRHSRLSSEQPKRAKEANHMQQEANSTWFAAWRLQLEPWPTCRYQQPCLPALSTRSLSKLRPRCPTINPKEICC